jgi:hypothetical protein
LNGRRGEKKVQSVAKRNKTPQEEPEQAGISDQLARIGKVLAMSAIRDANQQDQIKFLSSVGYTPTQIGSMLKTTPQRCERDIASAQTEEVAVLLAFSRGRQSRSEAFWRAAEEARARPRPAI